MLIPTYLVAKAIADSQKEHEAKKPDPPTLGKPLTPEQQEQLEVLQNARRHAEMTQQRELNRGRGL